MIIAEFECFGKSYQVVKTEKDVYNVEVDGIVTQPNHDAEGIIRYLSNICHAAGSVLNGYDE